MQIVMKSQDVVLSLHGPGAEVGEEGTLVPEGQVALIIESGGQSVAVVGTAQQLREQVYAGFSLPVPDDVPLVDFPDTIAELG